MKKAVLNSIIIASSVLVVFACGQKRDDVKSVQKLPDETAVGTVVDEILIHFAAEKLIADMSASLQASLREAIHDNSLDFAIDVCAHLAPEIAAAHSKEGWKIKRVSDKNRNPANVADSADLEILAQFASATPPDSIGRWGQSPNGLIYTYCKPIKTGALCLNCHGPAETLTPRVKERLTELYPRDRAVGYAEGDLRGMFVVKVNWPEGKAYAQKLVGAPEFQPDSL